MCSFLKACIFVDLPKTRVVDPDPDPYSIGSVDPDPYPDPDPDPGGQK